MVVSFSKELLEENSIKNYENLIQSKLKFYLR